MDFDSIVACLTSTPWNIVISVLLILVVGYLGSPLIVWTISLAAVLWMFQVPVEVYYVFAAIALIANITPIRRALVSNIVMKIMAPIMPAISDTERVALESGITWVEKDLFSGKPDLKKLMNEPYPDLTAEEKAFINGPVEKLCAMIDAWEVWRSREVSPEIWNFIKKEGFLGMIVPKEYGGKGFSALCHSEVIQKISSRSVSVGVTVMVPNSLGPAELLAHYGTDAQKDYYLPRLARGEEVPCFGLTEPTAGSDAGSINATGVVFKGQDGKLYLKLNWNKRWITLAAVSTIVGLAFRVKDPENLLGKNLGEDLGITCGLIPANTAGVVLGKRHDPLGVPFYNCPTQGHDVVVPIDAVVGGIEGIGQGWQMLMECLAAGRGISLPAQATGGAKLATRVCSAHAVVRQQFGVSIGKFEGLEEPLARMAGFTYMLEAARVYTCGALDKGIKPPVVTAMLKQYSTEIARRCMNDAMDVMGGAGISMGPRNLIAEGYIGMPISITVEGANIMTRTLIVFGQGALKSHPYAFKEVDAIAKKDLKAFDAAFWGHIGHIVHNLFRSVLLSVTRGYIAGSLGGPLAIYHRRLQWASASFAILADIAMGALGGQLKFREKITGRFADIMAHMYLATATLRRFEAEGRRKEDVVYAQWVLKYCFVEIQKAFDGLYDNIKVPGLVWFFKGWLGAWSRINSIGSQASDGHGSRLVATILTQNEQRDRLTHGVYLPVNDKNQQIGRLEHAMDVTLKSEAAEKKIRAAVKAKTLPKKKAFMLYDEAKAANIITADEYKLLKEGGAIRLDAIQVDDFTQEEYIARN